jgi:hypothetical protein
LISSGCYLSTDLSVSRDGVDCERQPEMCPPDPCNVPDGEEYDLWREHFGCHVDAS